MAWLRIIQISCLPVVAGIPFAAFTILVLRHFYVLGGFWGDSGAIAYLLWHSDWLLHMSKIGGGGSFFAIHVTPIFIPFSLLSRILPFSKIQFFAAFSGFCAALPALAIYWVLIRAFRTHIVIAVLLALLFAFNGVTLAAARNPHFEILIIGTGLLFFAALIQNQIRAAIFFFSVCLLTREDAGLHLFAFLAATIAIVGYRRMSLHLIRSWLIFAAAALAYSMAAIVLQHLFFPSGGSFTRVYIGTPPFAGITWPMIALRLGFFAAYRLYIFLPALLAILWACHVRNPLIAAGAIACLPWTLLHLFAAGLIAGTFSNYYSFPFIFALAWPLIAIRLEAQLTGRAIASMRPVAGFTFLLLASFADLSLQHNPGKIDLPRDFLHPPSLTVQTATDAALSRYAKPPPAFGRTIVDGSVAALDPNNYVESQLVSSPQQRPFDTILFFARGYQSGLVATLASQAALHNIYQIPNTSLRLITDRDLSGMVGLSPAPN